MARWRKGEEEVAQLVEQRHLQRVVADPEIANALLEEGYDEGKAIRIAIAKAKEWAASRE